MYRQFILPALVLLVSATAVQAQNVPDPQKLVRGIQEKLQTEIVRLSVENQNKKYADISAEDVQKLDQQWRDETQSEVKPLIAATLSSPLSAYLTRIQAHSLGLYTEIFVMDDKGLNVGQSNITSDYWQGDEAKWQKTYLKGADTVFIDEPEWNAETATWRVQVNLSLADMNGRAIGAATVEVNLTEWQRR
jgi:hypothetical protein